MSCRTMIDSIYYLIMAPCSCHMCFCSTAEVLHRIHLRLQVNPRWLLPSLLHPRPIKLVLHRIVQLHRLIPRLHLPSLLYPRLIPQVLLQRLRDRRRILQFLPRRQAHHRQTQRLVLGQPRSRLFLVSHRLRHQDFSLDQSLVVSRVTLTTMILAISTWSVSP